MIDYIKDKNKSYFYKIVSENPMPDFVKEASLTDEDNINKLNRNQFADSVLRMFPIASKADTWLSASYIQKQAMEGVQVRQEVVDKIKEVCELYNMPFDSFKPAQRLEKIASNGISIKYKDGDKVYADIPVDTIEDLQKIANDILTPGHHTYNIRKEVAQQALATATVLNFDLGRDKVISLQKTAGYAVSDLKDVKEAINVRRVAIQHTHPKHVESMLLLEKVAMDSAAETGIIAADVISNIASALDAVDRHASLTHKYSDKFTPPEHKLYKFAMCEIDEYNTNLIKTANGRHFSLGQFNQDKVKTFLSDVFGITDIPNLKEAIESLSVNSAKELEKYIDAFAKR
jgi:hypothetical protein